MVLISKIVVCFACWAAEAAAIVDVVAFVESFDDSGVKGLFLKLSLAGFFWCHLPWLLVDVLRVVGSGRGRRAAGFSGFVRSTRHYGFPGDPCPAATNDELGVGGLNELDKNG